MLPYVKTVSDTGWLDTRRLHQSLNSYQEHVISQLRTERSWLATHGGVSRFHGVDLDVRIPGSFKPRPDTGRLVD